MNLEFSSFGSGKELVQMLMREFNIPPTAQDFTIRVARNEAIKIECNYLAYTPEAGDPDKAKIA